jgi:hypothetical protein
VHPRVSFHEFAEVTSNIHLPTCSFESIITSKHRCRIDYMCIDWNKVIESAIGPLLGTLIGGGITIATLGIKESFDRRRSIQIWFEQTYITEGVNVLIGYLQFISFYLLKRGGKGLEGYASKTVYPHEAELRIDSLLPSARVAAITMVFSDYLCKTEAELQRIPEGKLNSITDSIEQVTDCLKRLRRYLMHFQIKAKTDIYEIGTSEFVRELKADLDKEKLESAEKQA